MAIFKARFTRSRGGAKASIGYIQTRPGKDREAVTRTLFSRDGAIGRLEAESFIDGAGKGSFFYRFVIAPDPSQEDAGRDINMEELTYKTMQTLDKRFHTTLLWIAALHDDHAEHRHVHCIAVVPKRLFVKDLARLRNSATRECVAQRRILDFGQESKERQRYPMFQTVKFGSIKPERRSSARGGSSTHMHACTCPRCGTSHIEYGRNRVHQCTCGLLLHRKKEPTLHRKGGRPGTLTQRVKRYLYGLAVLHSRGAAFLSHDHHKLHASRFARLHELRDLHTETFEDVKAGLILGVSPFNHIVSVRPTKNRQELGNLLVCARSRAGKGLLAVAQILSWPHSIIVNDIKGELFNATASDRAKDGIVLVVDPQGVGHRYDPFTGRHTEDKLYSSAKHLLFNPNDGEGEIFTQRASKMLTQIFLAARERNREAIKSNPLLKQSYLLPYVREIVDLGLKGAAARLDAISPQLAVRFLDEQFDPDANYTENRFLTSAWETLTSRLFPLLTQSVIRSFNGADFNLSLTVDGTWE